MKRWGIELPDITIYGWIKGTCQQLFASRRKPIAGDDRRKKGVTHRGDICGFTTHRQKDWFYLITLHIKVIAHANLFPFLNHF